MESEHTMTSLVTMKLLDCGKRKPIWFTVALSWSGLHEVHHSDLLGYVMAQPVVEVQH